MPSLRRKRGPMHEINIVPYVDVMLVLLVIFMVTAPLVTPGVIDLPSVAKAGQPKIVPIEIVVREDQQLLLRERNAAGNIVHEQSVSRAALSQIVHHVEHRLVAHVMDDLRKQSVARVGLQVKPAQ